MIKSCVFSQFSTELCAYINIDHEGYDVAMAKSREFISFMRKSNLFIIPLDNQNEWYRYHHLFSDLLYHEFLKRYNSDDIAALHEKAGEWFSDKEILAESIKHYLKAGKTDSAIQQLASYRIRLSNQSSFQQLEFINTFKIQISYPKV